MAKRAKHAGKLALHWKILIGMALGLAVGIIIASASAPTEDGRSDRLWKMLGVDDSGAYLSGSRFRASLPQGVGSVADLERGDAHLVGLKVEQLTLGQIEELGLESKGLVVERYNEDAGVVAGAARFVRRLTQFIGDLFIRSLRFIAVPIVLFSLIAGVASLNDVAKLGRIGAKTMVIYVGTTALAISIGLVLANVVRPGGMVGDEKRAEIVERFQSVGQSSVERNIGQSVSVWDTLRNLVPTNPFKALADGEMLQIVVFAVLIGVGLTMVRSELAKPVVALCEGMTEAIIKLVHVLMLAAPYAVFCLMAMVISDLGLDVLGAIAAYALVVVAGLAAMLYGVYPSILWLATRGAVGPRRFFSAIAPAQLLALSSSSSSATMPVTLQCVRDRLGVREDVTSFVIPLGATINMDGTALYQGVATAFIMQLFGMPMTITDQLMIVLTATLASIGTAGVPGVGMLMLVIVLKSVDVPAEVMAMGIAAIFGVDRLLDMCRTVVNITGDCMVAAVVGSTEGALLSPAELAKLGAGNGLDENP